MFVTNRNGEKEEVSFDKILTRVNRLVKMNNSIEGKINTTLICQKTISRMYDGIQTSELDNLAATVCAAMSVDNPYYEEVASRLTVSNLHKNTDDKYKNVVEILYKNTRSDDMNFPLVSDEFYNFVMENHETLDRIIDYNRDYNLGFFSLKTLEKSYLLKVNNKTIERPQHLFLRVAIGIHKDDIDSVRQTYDMLSKKYFTHATPTLYNSGTSRPQMSSCFLAGIDDSVEDIFETIGDLANISKWSGGIGLSIGDIRAENSIIRKTNGLSTGIMPLLKVLNGVSGIYKSRW
jgi:ribonucleoside-diphosphate reductase subunit M1